MIAFIKKHLRSICSMPFNSHLMLYLLFFLLVLTIASMLSARSFKKSNVKKLQRLRDNWGKKKKGEFDFNSIKIYSNNYTDFSFHTLSSQTKNDIDFDALFCFIDRTTTKVGQQFLYDALSKPIDNIEHLKMLQLQTNFFCDDNLRREKIQKVLEPLAKEDAYNIASLLSSDLPGKPSWYKWVVVYIIAVFIFLIFTRFHHKLLLWIMLPLAINVFFHYRTKNYTKLFKGAFPQLNILIKVCKKLRAANLPFSSEGLSQSIVNLKVIQNKGRLLSYDGHTLTDEFTEIGMYIFELIKGFFLIEFFAFNSLLKDVKKSRADILTLFQYAGSVDRALSIASLQADIQPTCTPVFLPAQKQLSFMQLYHPLIEDCVVNDLNLNEKSVLITGSNMSGKSTFLRSVAINAVLAQTIITCFAAKFCTPVLKLHSSIRIDDDLFDGKSYYFEEVTVMAALIDQVEQPWQNIFILDEVFKGTNTIERIASAKAILSFLNKNNNIVFVSTHDVELSSMLADEFDLYHFAELIEGDQFTFDHKLKAGPVITSNAIKILELHNYPDEIILEAKSISESFQLTVPQVS